MRNTKNRPFTRYIIVHDNLVQRVLECVPERKPRTIFQWGPGKKAIGIKINSANIMMLKLSIPNLEMKRHL